MALPNLAPMTTLAEDQYAALALARLNRHVKTLRHHQRADFYALKQRYIKALVQRTHYVVGIWHIDGLYEFHVEIGEQCYVWHQLPQEIDYPIQLGGLVIYEPRLALRPLNPRERLNCIAAVEAWLIEIGAS